MRKNCQRALRSWCQNEGAVSAPTESIWSDGETIWSYRTALVTKWGGTTVLNMSKYSTTTAVHQNALAAALPNATQVDGLPFGAGTYELGAALA